MLPARKTRDLFPLPLLKEVWWDVAHLGRKFQRRHLCKWHLESEVNTTARALSALYGCSGKRHCHLSLHEELSGHGSAQWDCLQFIQSRVQRMGKPSSDLCGRGALSALQAARGYADDQLVGSLASFNPEAISLPQPGWKPISLAALWGDDGHSMVNEFVSTQVLPEEEACAKLEACGVKQPYSDPMLRPGKVYHAFLSLRVFQGRDFEGRKFRAWYLYIPHLGHKPDKQEVTYPVKSDVQSNLCCRMLQTITQIQTIMNHKTTEVWFMDFVNDKRNDGCKTGNDGDNVPLSVQNFAGQTPESSNVQGKLHNSLRILVGWFSLTSFRLHYQGRARTYCVHCSRQYLPSI